MLISEMIIVANLITQRRFAIVLMPNWIINFQSSRRKLSGVKYTMGESMAEVPLPAITPQDIQVNIINTQNVCLVFLIYTGR